MKQQPYDANAIVEAYHVKCPVCGEEVFLEAERFVHLVALPTKEDEPHGVVVEDIATKTCIYPVTITSCKQCGYVMMFNTEHDLGKD